VFQAVSEDLLGLMDTPRKSVAGSVEMLGWEAVDGSPVGGTRPVSDGGLPVLGLNGGLGGSDRLLGVMDLNDPPLDLLLRGVDEVVPRFVHRAGLDDDEGPSDSKLKMDEAEQTTREAKAEYKEGWSDETAEEEAAHHQLILKALGSMGSGSFGRLAYHAVRTFEQARTPVTVPNVATAVVSFLDEHVVSTSRFKALSDQVLRYAGTDESKAVRALETQVRALTRQNEGLEHSLATVSTALSSHFTYIESLTRDWRNGLSEAQKGAAAADQRSREAFELCQTLRTDVSGLGGRLTQGRGLTFYRQTFPFHDSFVSFATSNKIGLGCAGDAFLLMHGDAVGVVSNEESLAVKNALLDNKLASGLQGLVVSSFTTSVPASFAPSKSSIAAVANSTKDILKRSAPKFDAWEDEQCAGGLRLRLQKAVSSCRGRIDMAIDSSEMSSQARELCKRVTSDSERFVNSLIDFIT
jgi:hypothetical protein